MFRSRALERGVATKGVTALPKSVLFVTYHFPPEIGGQHTRMLHYVENLRSRGISVTVFFIVSRGTETKRYFMNGAEINVFPGQYRFFPKIAYNLLSTSIAKRADAIHVVSGTSTLVGAFAIVLGRARRVPSEISFFGREAFQFLTPAHRWLFKITISLATSIGVNTLYASASIPPRFQKKVHVLLGGAEEPEYHVPQNEQEKTVLFVGRLVRTKGVDDLIRAFNLVQKRLPDARLVIVGDGPEMGNLGQIAESLGVGSKVEFKGTLRGPKLHDEYEKSLVVVLPSKHVRGEESSGEMLGLTLIEGSMHSKPLVGTSHGGIPEIIRDGQNGFLVPENNSPALADALVRLLSDERLSQLMGAEALRVATTKFTWNAATDRLLQSYIK